MRESPSSRRTGCRPRTPTAPCTPFAPNTEASISTTSKPRSGRPSRDPSPSPGRESPDPGRTCVGDDRNLPWRKGPHPLSSTHVSPFDDLHELSGNDDIFPGKDPPPVALSSDFRGYHDGSVRRDVDERRHSGTSSNDDTAPGRKRRHRHRGDPSIPEESKVNGPGHPGGRARRPSSGM